MTQLSNVPMQPNQNAVERPLTLVEKLEQKIESLENYFKQSPIVNDEIATVHASIVAGLKMAINIVKQHSDWISVDERLPPDNMMVLAYCNIRKTTGYAFVSSQQAWSFYHFTKNSENQAMAMVNDISKWMPIPQPPSEVQDD